MQIRFRRVDWEFAATFRIAYRVQTHAETVLLEIEDPRGVGRGEASGVSYHGETADSILDQLAAFKAELRNDVSRADLHHILPAGGARCAVDCALWDLEAKALSRRAWEIAGVGSVRPLVTAYTLGLDTPDATARRAIAAGRYAVLKLKLDGEADLERVAAVRKARPDAEIVIDANQSWDERLLREWSPKMAEQGVRLIEQPLPVGRDGALAGFAGPVPICADESCQTRESLTALVGKYQYVNIKLDKTGGLTEALRLARAAREQGLKLMVGCMGGSSLSMAPAFIVGQYCDIVDLDSPLLIKTDVPEAIRYDGSLMQPPSVALWG